MNEFGYNINLFKKNFELDSYWLHNLGYRDFTVVKYLFNRIYEEKNIFDKYVIVQEIIKYTRTQQQKNPKYNTYVYQELRNQFEAFQAEMKQIDWQLAHKLKEYEEQQEQIFNN